MVANTKVMIQNRQNRVKIPTGSRQLIKRCCNAVLKHENIEHVVEISISITDDAEIRELNNCFRGKDRTTDVLSFPLIKEKDVSIDPNIGVCFLGDIVISIERAVEQAELYGHSLERELGFLTVHSMLHLLGYKHESGGIKARIMRDKEENILNSLGLSRESSFIYKNGD